tara:strand:+ start:849 stop:1043 length:195 start_codon:yes stop_codon:yes gene_type:complete
MKDKEFYFEALKEIKKMKEYLEEELEDLEIKLRSFQLVRRQIMELQDEVAKMQKQPVGMLFTLR